MDSATTIQISMDTRDMLKGLGKKGETYDQLLLRLIKLAMKAEFFEEMDRITETEEFVPLDEI